MFRLLQNKAGRFFLLLIMIIALPLAGRSQATKPPHAIVFIENSWDEALRQAAKQHKYIFVDAYATWCGPCKMLKATTFHNQKVADFYNANFINVSIDMEKGDGPKLSTAWGLQAYPTLIIFDSTGKPLLGTAGYMGANDLLAFGKQGLSKS
jgi:thioredoxin 1